MKDPEEIQVPIWARQTKTKAIISCAIVPLEGDADFLLSNEARETLRLEWPVEGAISRKKKETPTCNPRIKITPEDQDREFDEKKTEKPQILRPIPLVIERLLLKFKSALVPTLEKA